MVVWFPINRDRRVVGSGADRAGLFANSARWLHDPVGRRNAINHSFATMSRNYTFGFDKGDRLIRWRDPNTPEDDPSTPTVNERWDDNQAEHDKNNQLTFVDHAYSRLDEAHTYDGNGNRSDNATFTGGFNRITEDSNYVYTTDADGNITQRTRKSQVAAHDEYTWDYRHRGGKAGSPDRQVVRATRYGAVRSGPDTRETAIFAQRPPPFGNTVDKNPCVRLSRLVCGKENSRISP